jgi:hypothetical protein
MSKQTVQKVVDLLESEPGIVFGLICSATNLQQGGIPFKIAKPM